MRSLGIFLFILFISQPSQAYWSTLQTGDILHKTSNRFIFDGQYITSGNNKFNYAGRFDWGLSRSSSFRFLGGSGDVRFGGLEYKWVPFPDFGRQPAVGMVFGAVRGTFEGVTTNTLRFQPIVSKAYVWERGLIIPYTSLALGIARPQNQKKYYPSQLVFGSEWISDRRDSFTWILEVGLDLNKAFTYATLGFVFNFKDRYSPHDSPYDRREDRYEDRREDRPDDRYDRRREPGPGTYDRQRYEDPKKKQDHEDLPY